MKRPHTKINICIQLHQRLAHRILTRLPTFWYTTETLNRYYTSKRLSHKRNPQRLHQQMEETNERSLQSHIEAKEE